MWIKFHFENLGIENSGIDEDTLWFGRTVHWAVSSETQTSKLDKKPLKKPRHLWEKFSCKLNLQRGCWNNRITCKIFYFCSFFPFFLYASRGAKWAAQHCSALNKEISVLKVASGWSNLISSKWKWANQYLIWPASTRGHCIECNWMLFKILLWKNKIVGWINAVFMKW